VCFISCLSTLLGRITGKQEKLNKHWQNAGHSLRYHLSLDAL
jgi:hypothetical protein